MWDVLLVPKRWVCVCVCVCAYVIMCECELLPFLPKMKLTLGQRSTTSLAWHIKSVSSTLSRTPMLASAWEHTEDNTWSGGHINSGTVHA